MKVKYTFKAIHFIKVKIVYIVLGEHLSKPQKWNYEYIKNIFKAIHFIKVKIVYIVLGEHLSKPEKWNYKYITIIYSKQFISLKLNI